MQGAAFTGPTRFLSIGDTYASNTALTYTYSSNRLTGVSLVDTATQASVGGMAFLYDLAGNMTSRQEVGESAVTMTRDVFHQLTQYGSVQYEYDHSGQRVVKYDLDRTVYYFYDGGTLSGKLENSW